MAWHLSTVSSMCIGKLNYWILDFSLALPLQMRASVTVSILAFRGVHWIPLYNWKRMPFHWPSNVVVAGGVPVFYILLIHQWAQRCRSDQPIIYIILIVKIDGISVLSEWKIASKCQQNTELNQTASYFHSESNKLFLRRFTPRRSPVYGHTASTQFFVIILPETAYWMWDPNNIKDMAF